jgi:hypothetical protein
LSQIEGWRVSFFAQMTKLMETIQTSASQTSFRMDIV